MSAIEETLQRIQDSTDAFCIMDKDGNVLRHKNLTEAQALTVASAFFSVTHRAMHAVRDMDPEDSLSFVRIRMKTMEVIAAPVMDPALLGLYESALLTAVPGDKAPSDLVKDIDRSVAVRSALARREGEASFRAIELARAKLTDKDLPEDLAVPEPADIIDRTAAASIDALGAAAGATVAGLAMVTMGLPETVCAHGAVACGLTLFALRDVLWEEGTRSMGKAALDLEVSTWDGRIASHWQSLVRNLPVLVLPLWDVHPVAQQAFLLIVGFDIVSMVLTPDRRRIGDYMAATSCVTERPGRELRVMDLVERDELAAVEEAVSFIDPEALRTLQEGHEDDPVPLSAIAEAGGDIARMPDTKLLRRKAKRAVGPSIVLPGMMEARRQGTLGETKRRVQFVARSLDPEAPPPPPPPNASHAGDKEPQRQIGGGRGQ